MHKNYAKLINPIILQAELYVIQWSHEYYFFMLKSMGRVKPLPGVAICIIVLQTDVFVFSNAIIVKSLHT